MKLCRYCANIMVRKIEIEKINDKGEKYSVDSFETFCPINGEIKNHLSRACERYTLSLTYKNNNASIKLSPKEKDVLRGFKNDYNTVSVEGNRNKLRLERITIKEKPHTVEGMVIIEERESISELYIPCRNMFNDLVKFRKYNIKDLIRGEE